MAVIPCRRPLVLAGVLVFAAAAGGCASTPPQEDARLEAPVVIDPAVQIANLLLQGDAAARAGQVEQAFHYYLRAEQLDPRDDRALIRAGNLHRVLGKRETAEKAWRMALERNPQNAATHESLGFLLLESGRAAAALDSFEAALNLAPQTLRAEIGLGLSCEKQLDFARALRTYDDALLRDPASVELRTYRARALMGLGRFAEARASIAGIVNEPLPVTWIVRGDLFAIDGEYAAALGAYLETLDEPWAYQRLGEHALRREDYERAMRYFRRAADASPEYFEDADRGMAVAREHLITSDDSR